MQGNYLHPVVLIWEVQRVSLEALYVL